MGRRICNSGDYFLRLFISFFYFMFLEVTQ